MLASVRGPAVFCDATDSHHSDGMMRLGQRFGGTRTRKRRERDTSHKGRDPHPLGPPSGRTYHQPSRANISEPKPDRVREIACSRSVPLRVPCPHNGLRPWLSPSSSPQPWLRLWNQRDRLGSPWRTPSTDGDRAQGPSQSSAGQRPGAARSSALTQDPTCGDVKCAG
jgi:hypothetical protein